MAATKEFYPYVAKPKKKVPKQVKLIVGLDQFQLASNPDCGAATRALPPVRASDIVSYNFSPADKFYYRISIDTIIIIIIIITTVKC